MLSKSDKKRKPMRTAALLTREALEALVTHQERRVGRVNAYKDVADLVGSSASWVRKFLADSKEVKEPRLTLFQNIRAHYVKLCDRVEQQNRIDELRLRMIEGELHAVTEGLSAEDQSQVEASDGRFDQTDRH